MGICESKPIEFQKIASVRGDCVFFKFSCCVGHEDTRLHLRKIPFKVRVNRRQSASVSFCENLSCSDTVSHPSSSTSSDHQHR
jgi:hypothetical protein